MPAKDSGRDPCPGCGRLMAYRTKKDRAAWDTVRVSHKCPHGRRCVAGTMSVGVNWQPGDALHASRCPLCTDAVRARVTMAPMSTDPLRRELDNGKRLAAALVDHLASMGGAAETTIPVIAPDIHGRIREWEVTVRLKCDAGAEAPPS
jgi:hypothetical protein